MKVKGIVEVEVEVDPNTIDLSLIDLNENNIERFINNLYKRIGLENYKELGNLYVYKQEETQSLYLQEQEETEPTVITTNEKIIELFEMVQQLEEKLKAYITKTDTIHYIRQIKKSGR